MIYFALCAMLGIAGLIGAGVHGLLDNRPVCKQPTVIPAVRTDIPIRKWASAANPGPTAADRPQVEARVAAQAPHAHSR
jgi:hypothetical protein